MDLSIRSVSRSSSVSAREFAPGDRVESFLYRSESGELERADLFPEELADWTMPTQLLCRWTHQIRDRSDAEGEARKQALQSAEEMFIALVESEGDKNTSESEGDSNSETARDRVILINLIALILERKRVLRVRGRDRSLYYHPALKKEFRIPLADMQPEELLRIESQLGQLI